MIQIAVLGYGTIGSGVAEVLKVNKESITKRVGDEISIKYILICVNFREIRWKIRLYMIMRLSKRSGDRNRGGSHGWCGAGIHICETGTGEW